ncbi:hypothetical protein [Magnetofaba australis]|uniref:hypothetical protein n=1 Tax=Magnetofaba australis TaxID=1472297 RepID=UPI000A19CD4B|nr:hypothetical protein [Magnetofaba australis]
MALTLVMAHGWGLGPGLWRPMRRHLEPHWPVQAIDLGFVGAGDWQTPPAGEWVGVGHSLGGQWLMQGLVTQQNPECADPHPWGAEAWTRCRGLCFIAAAPRFAHAEGFAEGVSPRILQRMRKRLGEDPAQVLKEFGQRGGVPDFMNRGAPATLDAARLDAGLAWLADWDARDALAATPLPWRLIAAQDDPVMTPSMLRAAYGACADDPQISHWMADGGHMLPLTRAAQCAQTLMRFLETLA